MTLEQFKFIYNDSLKYMALHIKLNLIPFYVLCGTKLHMFTYQAIACQTNVPTERFDTCCVWIMAKMCTIWFKAQALQLFNYRALMFSDPYGRTFSIVCLIKNSLMHDNLFTSGAEPGGGIVRISFETENAAWVYFLIKHFYKKSFDRKNHKHIFQTKYHHNHI